MAYLGSHTAQRAVMQSHHFAPRKRYGQNFLADEVVLKDIVEISSITKEDLVLEIGPGLGSMTQYLCEAAGKVVAIEVDGALIPILEDTLSSYGNVSIIHADILKTDVNKIDEIKEFPGKIKVVANLPYYITTPIIMSLLKLNDIISDITVMVQKEVALRMQAVPGGKEYGALSVFVQYYAEAKVERIVPASCFVPKPEVDSAVIKLSIRKEPPVKVTDEELMFDIVRAAFGQRRKTLANAIKNAPKLVFEREEVENALEAIGRGRDIRGESLSMEEFAALSNKLQKISGNK